MFHLLIWEVCDVERLKGWRPLPLRVGQRAPKWQYLLGQLYKKLGHIFSVRRTIFRGVLTLMPNLTLRLYQLGEWIRRSP